ncbi:MAG: hypothetical protein H6681_01745 [Desulfobacteraceae bacterium]|nr:hypothetical protein [Desulfobacteraceae bacterium]MCB9494151.1 hypothetical protein [Desulfobacteraceae bacterium]
MKKIFFMFLVVFITASSGFSYEGTPKEQTELFFNELLSGKINNAVDNLYSSNTLMGQKIQQLEALKQQIAMLDKLYGKALGHEYYCVEKKTDSVVRIAAVFKYEFHPVVWEFYFYKPSKKWIISQGVFNDQFELLSGSDD